MGYGEWTSSTARLALRTRISIRRSPGRWPGVICARFGSPSDVRRTSRSAALTPRKLMGELLTVYRGKNGRLHVTQSHCPHRAALLSSGWVEGDTLRCRYHGWRYDETGQCVEQPGEDAAFASKICLRTYPAQDYLGLVFAYLGEGDAPPMRRFPDCERPGVGEGGRVDRTLAVQFFQSYRQRGRPGAPDLHTPRIVAPLGRSRPSAIRADRTDRAAGRRSRITACARAKRVRVIR